MMLALFSKKSRGVDPAWLADVRARQAAAREYAVRIQGAVEDAGFDSRMLDELPATYVAAALALGVK